MIFSTLRNITKEIPQINEDNLTCSKYLYSLNQNTKDGGLRKNGLYKKTIKNKPLISIITIVFNNVEYIERTILSVLRQNYDNIEYIIIDGGSTDGTYEIIKNYEGFIDYYVSEKDNGIYDAMNKGLSFSTGDYILMLNSGDYLASSKVIKKVINNIIKNGLPHIIYGKVYYFDEKTKKKFLGYEIMKDYYLYEYNTSLPHQATFIHRKAYNLVGGYDLQLVVGSDAIWTYNAKLFNLNFKYVDLVVSYYQMGGHSSKNDYLLERYSYLYTKGPWDYEEFKNKFINTFNIKSVDELQNYYTSNSKILKKYNLENIFINILNKNNYYDILIVNEDNANPFNKNIVNILSLLGYSAKCSCLDFFLNIKYKLIILEWESYLLHDSFYPKNTNYEEKLAILESILKYYKENNTKIICILHNKIDHQYKFNNELYNKNYNFKKFIYSKCDAIIHLGLNGMKECIDFYDLSGIKNYVIPHSLYTNYNIRYNKKDSKKILKIKEKDIVIGCFGALRHQEEYELVLKSFDNLKISNKILLLIGNHSENVKFKKRKNCIIVKDFLKQEKYSIYLNSTDIIFLPRIYSLNSGILFLALSYSKLVVGPDTGNIGEYLKMFGYPVYKNEEEVSQALEKGIELLQKDPDIVYKNRIKAEELFSNYNLSLKFKEVFNDLGIEFELLEDEKILNEIVGYNIEKITKENNELKEELNFPINVRIKILAKTLLIKILKKFIWFLKLL